MISNQKNRKKISKRVIKDLPAKDYMLTSVYVSLTIVYSRYMDYFFGIDKTPKDFS